jgi:hypothetical protein
MARRLILIDEPRRVLDGATPIEPGYPRDYSPDEMRSWATDLERYYRTPVEDLARWRAAPPESLAPEQQRVVAVYDKFFVASERGIKGTLREDGKVELRGGRHRAAYLMERGTTPIPVWVTARDERQLDELGRRGRRRERSEDRGEQRV